MTYQVLYTANVQAEISDQITYLRNQGASPEVIDKWFNELFDAIDALYHWPKRNPVVPEQTAEEGFEIRKLVYGNYLVFYRVNDEKRLVEVLAFVHGARLKEGI